MRGGEDEILGVHEALEELARVDARLVQVVEMRYFAGMTETEIAAALGINDRTVRRDWQKATPAAGGCAEVKTEAVRILAANSVIDRPGKCTEALMHKYQIDAEAGRR